MTQSQDLSGKYARIQYFQLITALLCEPEKETVHNAELYIQLQQCVGTIQPDLKPMVDKLKKSSEKELTALMIEYARLFIGPFKLVAPPYASCYLGSKELNNEITDWVRQFYETSGLEFDYTIMDLPDHIAVETEFLHYLATRQLIAENEENTEDVTNFGKRYHAFLNDHHKQWVPIFSQQVINESSEPFYQVLCRLIMKMLPSL
jgi:TorA maturation chaperone TorD